MKFTKSSPGLIQLFRAVVADLPRGAELRKMFGYDACFVNGNMAAGLWQDTCVFKLSDADAKALTKLGAVPFAPMKGRVMTGWYEAPEDVAHDPETLEHWCRRAFDFAAAAPPKTKATKKKVAKKTGSKKAASKARG